MSSFREGKVRVARQFIQAAENERDEFKRKNDIVYLQQAGNKLYNAHVYYLESYYEIEIGSNDEVIIYGRKLAKENKKFRELRARLLALHKWFYEGTEDIKEALSYVNRSIIDLNILLRR